MNEVFTARKKGRFADRPHSKKHSLASYQFQSTSTTSNKLPEPRRYFMALGLVLKPMIEPLQVTDCPFCRFADGFVLCPATGGWRCTGCGAHGNGIVKLHSQLHSISMGQAQEQLAALANAGAP